MYGRSRVNVKVAPAQHATRHLAVFPCSWSTEMHADKNCLVSLEKEKTVFFFFFIPRHKQMMETCDCA